MVTESRQCHKRTEQTTNGRKGIGLFIEAGALAMRNHLEKTAYTSERKPTQFGLSVVGYRARLDLAIHSNYLCIFISTYFMMKKAIKCPT